MVNQVSHIAPIADASQTSIQDLMNAAAMVPSLIKEYRELKLEVSGLREDLHNLELKHYGDGKIIEGTDKVLEALNQYARPGKVYNIRTATHFINKLKESPLYNQGKDYGEVEGRKRNKYWVKLELIKKYAKGINIFPG